MGGSYLPPGVTPADIDKHFGGAAMRELPAEAHVDVALSEDVDPTDLLDFSARDPEVVHVEDVESVRDEHIKCVYVAFVYETQHGDPSEQREDASDAFEVTSTDERVTHVDHVDTEVRP